MKLFGGFMKATIRLIGLFLVFATVAWGQQQPCQERKVEFTPGVWLNTYCSSPSFDLAVHFDGIDHGKDTEGNPWTKSSWDFVDQRPSDPNNPQIFSVHMIVFDTPGAVDIPTTLSGLDPIRNLIGWTLQKDTRWDTGTLEARTLYLTKPGQRQPDGSWRRPRGEIFRVVVNKCTNATFILTADTNDNWDVGESWMYSFLVKKCK
jgi:hypothetical protein